MLRFREHLRSRANGNRFDIVPPVRLYLIVESVS